MYFRIRKDHMPTKLIKLNEQQKLELIEYRRFLHQFPELGFEEIKTSRFIIEKLESFGVEMRKGVAKTGVVALIRGHKIGPTIMLRVDMDALPIQEQNQLDYASKTQGVMHA